VPYNFEDMPPKTHTFLRQRTLLRAPSAQSDSRERSVLCFAIHLRFTCSRRGTVYLHRSVHVVFAGMSPDKDALLETVVEGPRDPIYTPWSKGPRHRERHTEDGEEGGAAVDVPHPATSSRLSPCGDTLRQRRSVLGSVPFALDADGCPQPSCDLPQRTVRAYAGNVHSVPRCSPPQSPKRPGLGYFTATRADSVVSEDAMATSVDVLPSPASASTERCCATFIQAADSDDDALM